MSPYTGWTRAHWEATADQMLLAVRPYAGPGHALIDLPGPASRSGRWSDGLEGFARTFLLAAFRLAGAGGADPLDLASWYAEGLATGTDPASGSRWPRMDEAGQAKVEAASIAIALHETRPWIWDRLDSSVRERVLDWFGVFAGAWVPDNNWVWFRAVVAAFSQAAGSSWAVPSDISTAIDRTESWYAGGGWYSDGGTRNFDHYSGWAMQLYPLWFCRVAGRPELLDRYRSRLREYLLDLSHLVGGDGSPLFQGRSLTYRFAALAPFWTGALFDATPLAPGLTRRIASGMLRHFLSAGCLRPDGTLSIGWHGEFVPIRQMYSGPASPYWASKGFAGLLLPPDDPVWRSVEERMPAERADFTRAIAAPGWVASGTAADGIVRVANHGTDHTSGPPDDPFYCRWSYATRTGPDLGGFADSTVALIDADGRPSHRRPLVRVRVAGRTGVSRHQAHWPPFASEPGTAGTAGVAGTAAPAGVSGPWLTTASVVRGCWEVRAVRVEGDADPGWLLHLGGWLVAAPEPPAASVGATTASVSQAEGLTSTITVLRGPLAPAVSRPEGGNAFGAHAAIPYVRSTAPLVPGEVYAVAVALAGTPAAIGDPPRLALAPATGSAPAPAPAPAPGTPGLRITWPDGEHDPLPLNPPLTPETPSVPGVPPIP